MALQDGAQQSQPPLHPGSTRRPGADPHTAAPSPVHQGQRRPGPAQRRRQGSQRPLALAWLVLGLALTTLPAAAIELSSATTLRWVAVTTPAGAPAATGLEVSQTIPAAAAPAVSGPAAAAAAGAEVCRTMGPGLVYLVCATVFLGSLAVIMGLFRALRRQGWSLANALSEPTHLRIPRQAGWSESQGDHSASQEGNFSSAPVAVTVMEASSSRMIATLGSIAILLLFLGFGVFALFSFGLTCVLPASTGSITSFLWSGLALFAPYVANKISSLARPAAAGAEPTAASPAPLAVAPPAGQAPKAAGSLPPAPEPGLPAAAAMSQPGGAQRTDQPAEGAPPRQPLAAPTSPAAVATEPLAAAAATPTPTVPPAAAAPRSQPASHPSAAIAASVPAAGHKQGLPTAPGIATIAAADSRPAHPAAAAPQSASGGGSDALQPAVALIATFEGFVGHAYPDPASGGEPWTIGYGFTTLDGRPVRPGDQISQARAEQLLHQGVQACAAHLAGTIPDWGEMAADQRCALISFAWNLGQDFYGDEQDFATISRVLRQKDWTAVPQALCLYINPGSPVSAGLLRRRQAEGALWDQGLASLSSTDRTSQASPAASRGTAAASGTRAHPNPLSVPWFDQLQMDDGEGWRDCFSASSAMLAAYWGRIGNEDAYNQLRQRYGDSTSAEAQLDALRQLGLQADFRTDGDVADLRQEIDAGRPVAVGWLHHGPSSDPSGGGHWTVVIGYDASGVIMNDPYGNCDLVNGGYLSNHDGAGLHYSYRNWLPRWRVGGTGGWMLTCRL